MRTLQIIFCILACVCVVGIVPAGILWSWWCLPFVLGAAVFSVAMLLCRRAQEPKAPPRPDFMNSDEENERIRRETEKKD